MTETEIAAELERAEPAISFAVNRMLPLAAQDREDAAQTARLGLLKAMRKGFVFRTHCGFQVAARNAITNSYRCYRGRHLRFDGYEREKALNTTPSREQDAASVIAGEEIVQVVMATVREQFNPLHCEMFELYLNGLNQRDICRRFKRSKAAVCRAIHAMVDAAAMVLGADQRRGLKGKGR